MGGCGILGGGGRVQPARISAAALNIDPASFSDSPSGHKYRTPLTSYSLWRQMVEVLFVYRIYFLPGQIRPGQISGSSIRFNLMAIVDR